MTDEQTIDALIALRRALPFPAGESAEFGDDPTDGLRLRIPGDPDWWLQVVPLESGWQVLEVQRLPPPLPQRARELGVAQEGIEQGGGPDLLPFIDRHYRRLLLERRNAACGTPIR